MGDVRILMIDDNFSDRYFVREALKQSSRGTELDIVKDAAEGIDYLFKRRFYAKYPDPTLIILDLNLPGKDGREVLAELRADSAHREIPVIVFSSSLTELAKKELLDLGADSCFAKPVEFDDLFHTIQAIEEFAIGLSEFPTQKPALKRKLLSLAA